MKFIFLTMVFFLTVFSIGLCAVPEPNAGISDANYYGVNEAIHRTGRGEFAGNEIYGNSNGYGIFANHFRTAATIYSDVGLAIQTKSPNWSLLVGQRRITSDNDDNAGELFYGAIFKQGLSRNLSAYATYQKGVRFATEIFGISYDVTDFIQLNVCWKNYADNNGTTFKGIGESLQIKF